SILKKILTYFTGRHSGDPIEFVEESVDHILLCLSHFCGDSSGLSPFLFTKTHTAIRFRQCNMARLIFTGGYP
ncbi:hypothetical protein, partial [Pantoea stewartii]|uniref:hypothetical protein n=1 Tax=Pantoea stewartii TaxID=66269 RepID=UPI001B8851AC